MKENEKKFREFQAKIDWILCKKIIIIKKTQ